MYIIEKLETKLRKAQKPDMLSVENLPIDSGDTIVLCAGFEDRSKYVLKCLQEMSIIEVNIILVNYLPFLKENEADKTELLCKETGYTVTNYAYDRENPIRAGFDIKSLILEGVNKIWIDISGMSKLLIVQLINALSIDQTQLSKTNVLYCKSLEYPPSKDSVYKNNKCEIGATTFPQYFLTSGVFEVAIIPELSSSAMSGQPTRLIFFPSFSCEQYIALTTEIQPSYLSLIHGIPPAKHNKWRPKAIRKLNHISKKHNIEELCSSTLDYRDTFDLLLKLYARHGDNNRLLISPTGSKMQAVAVALFRSFFNDCQVIYPTPREFTSPKAYTKGVEQIYMLDLNLFSHLLEQLHK